MKKVPIAALLSVVVFVLCFTLSGCGYRTENATDLVKLNIGQVIEGLSDPMLFVTINWDGDVELEVTTQHTLGDEVTEEKQQLSVGEMFNWTPDQNARYQTQTFVMKIIVFEEDNIVGYAVVWAKYYAASDGTPSMDKKVVEAKRFPQVNGSYQQISEEHVSQQIENALKRV